MDEIKPQLTPHLNLWVELAGSVVLSRWRVQLLEAIQETGSISGAADRLGIQYRLAWDRLQEMESGLGTRLVDRQVGGAGGGGAQLTPPARDFVARFGAFAARVEEIVSAEFNNAFYPD